MRPRPFTLLFIAAAAAGLLFAAFSTYDFVQHLDRQVHGIHCSFIPGLSGTDASGATGCHTTMMSPYSSVLRSQFWGGLPVSLPAMGVFGFLLFRALDLLINRRDRDSGVTGFLVLAALLPVLTSMAFGYLSLVELQATCKLCIGIYASSALSFVSAFALWRGTRSGENQYDEDGNELVHAGMSHHVLSFAQGVGFVAIPAVLYVGLMPDYTKYIGSCGTLTKPEDPAGIMVNLDNNPTGTPTIEVLDPLCPACRGFEDRLEASGLDAKLDRKAVMFPLDNTCNWMVSSSLHPGACAISEAVLCAGDKAPAVLAWAFENQEMVRTAATTDPNGAVKLVTTAFPDLMGCIGSAKARANLNKSLRWVVANQLPVLTPQIYVNNTKLCDEDTDLGMDWALTRLLEQQGVAAAGGAR